MQFEFGQFLRDGVTPLFTVLHDRQSGMGVGDSAPHVPVVSGHESDGIGQLLEGH